jgi:AcrR family transcriptional regulator
MVCYRSRPAISIPYRMDSKIGKNVRTTPLDRPAWIKGALAVLAEDGPAGLRVELLAKKLNVTKGSFYWHFKDRRDLIDAVLDEWKLGRIQDIHKQTAAQPGDELMALRHTIDVYSVGRNRKGLPIELAVREWARRDATAAAVVEEVDAERLACAASLFEARGLTPQEAAARSVLLYAYVFGFSLMRCDRFTTDIAGAKDWITGRIAD